MSYIKINVLLKPGAKLLIKRFDLFGIAYNKRYLEHF